MSTAPDRAARLAGSAALALALALALVACTDDAPDPAEVGETAEGTAARLADALEARSLDEVPFTEVTGAEASADLGDVVEGMGDRSPQVELGEVTEDGESATATLTWTWPLTEETGDGAEGPEPDPADTGEWTYDSRVTLRRVGDRWQAEWGHQVVEPSLNAASVLDASTVPATRGDIVGAGGVKLVTDRPVVRVGIDRAAVPQAEAGRSARALARLVDIDVAPYAKAVRGAGAKAFVEAITFRQADVPPAVLRGYEAIPGATLVRTERPLAPTREFAAPILGTVGEVTAEMVADESDRYQPGDVAGLSGLQARYDEQLQGEAGVVVDAVGSDGVERELFRSGGGAGQTLQLTLDERLQAEAEAVLSDVGPASALVAIRPSDGAILAAANGPGNDGQNLATFGQYAPGSTFKTVSSLALLRRGLTPDAAVPCTPTVDVDGRDFENYDDYPAGGTGQIPFRAALASSCNTAFIAERTRLRDGDLAAAAASLGLGIDHDLGFPAYFGQVEPPTTETGRAADMIGQGTILASPMVMATVAASVQAGTTVVPRLVQQVDVEVPAEATPLAPREAEQLRSLLRGVVTDGSGRFLADLPGPPVLAKTGTAEYAAGDGVRTHAWMIAAQGDLAVAVFVQDGASGSSTAGPLLEAFLRAAR
ncbi:penicillin-binding transpeptidase domain-containing protein [Nocardioides litoris]|uniref:penicillin-binding transpeptidase domain-containing protein n=1 Tax=Nocardioides litoris TaxID=1926648 RepID=UPI00111DDEF6|nr:penicillin-binding transpeptidase domain-containing protein [Nocardioides litoris]